jgi:hypothetical protein
VPVIAEGAVIASDDGFVWSLHIQGSAPVTEALYPVLGGLKGDALFFPHHAGERVLDPARTLLSDRYFAFSGCPTVRGEDGLIGRETSYCGQASMAWMEVDGHGFGVYLGSHDPAFGLTRLRTETDGTVLTLALRRYGTIGAGGDWVLPPAVLLAHDGDWHVGARLYRNWIEPLLPRTRGSAALQGRGIQSQWGSKRDGSIRYTFDDLPREAEAGTRAGFDHVVVGRWYRGGRAPEFYPDMELGTAGDLTAAMQQLHSQGNTVSLELDARRFDTASEYYATLGSRWSVKDEAGWPHLEQDGISRYAAMCPGHEGWRHVVTDTARWLRQSTGCEGFYLSHIGTGVPHPCHDASHQHHHPGEHNQGVMRLLDELHSVADLVLDGCGDLLSSRASASLCYSPELYDEYFALYRYTFPEHPMINAVQPRRGSDPAARERVFYRDLERAWLLGSYFWSNPDAFRPGDDRLLGDLARAIRLRRLAEPYLADARYRDTDELAIDGARVTRFDGKDCTLLAVANPLGVPGSVTVAEPPATVTCLEVGKESERNWSKDGRRILLPTASLSLLILR